MVPLGAERGVEGDPDRDPSMNRNTLCRYSRFYAFTTTLINPHSGWEERKKHDDPRFLIRHLVDRS